jgi:hypothetical protein
MNPWEREALERLRNEKRREEQVPLYDFVEEPPADWKPERPQWWDYGVDKSPRGVWEV